MTPQVEALGKAFGIFVGLYNKTNNTGLSVRQAAQIEPFVAMFKKTQHILNISTVTISKHPKYRRGRSLNRPSM